jgi:hypothetical protein
MRSNRVSDPRRGERGTVAGRHGQRWRMRRTLMALEDRRLLSTIVVNNPTDTPVVGQIDLRQAIALANPNEREERDDHLLQQRRHLCHRDLTLSSTAGFSRWPASPGAHHRRPGKDRFRSGVSPH